MTMLTNCMVLLINKCDDLVYIGETGQCVKKYPL